MDKVVSNQQARVSVSIITYGHENYIEQALDSVFAQETSFPLQIHIGEDCSPDNSRNLIKSYCEKYPNIVPRFYEENVGGKSNFLDGLAACTGDYIALLDGDDYWTDSTKLQRQVDLMDANPSLSMCFHAVEEIPDGELEGTIEYPPNRLSTYDVEDMAKYLNIHTSSVLVRRTALVGWRDFFEPKDLPCGDWPLYAYATRSGPAQYIDSVMSVHRLHAEGVWHDMRSDRIAALESNIEVVDALMDGLDKDYEPAYLNSKASRYFDLCHAHVEQGDRMAAKSCLDKALERGAFNRDVAPYEPALSLTDLYAPWLYRAAKRLKSML